MIFDPEQDKRGFNRLGFGNFTTNIGMLREVPPVDAEYEALVEAYNKKWHEKNDKVINLWEDK